MTASMPDLGPDPASATSRSPDFLVVGPEKTGTTWIDRQLRQHPEVGLPPVKELAYFWEASSRPDEGALTRLATGRHWHHERYRRYLRYRAAQALRHPRSAWSNRTRLGWDRRYLFGRRDDEWYRRCFDGLEGLTGDISPQYFFLPEPAIAHIHGVCPHAKVLVTLREPADWIWSFARMQRKKRGATDAEIDAFVDRKIATNSFSRSCARWLDLYPEGRVRILFYETLRDDPWRFYVELCDFLGLEPRDDLREQLGRRVNEGQREAVPARLRERIAQGWREDVAALERLIGPLPASWAAPSGGVR